eukprot:CAMPEP_0168582516 /NCGR_PEP_ID=MMETSP0420-20121227/2023_1 /TAXON_ID=498008 /ORGANISM="Pessonella sp." /LENGTH=155 /DNA_ID=CAMNT_0008617007 /DNA_START=137 /DNA_END=604 /DNA_ORIENTATION=+
MTPSGRFEPSKAICFSFSNFHPELWNPMWRVGTILQGLLSFMLSDEMTTGGMESDDNTKKRLAAESLEYNLKEAQLFGERFKNGKIENNNDDNDNDNNDNSNKRKRNRIRQANWATRVWQFLFVDELSFDHVLCVVLLDLTLRCALAITENNTTL